MIATDGFREQVVDIDDNELVTRLILLVLRDRERVGDDDLVDDVAVVHLLETVTAKESMSSKAIDLGCASTLDDCLRGCDPGCRLVHHVIHNEHWPIFDVADKCDHSLKLRVLEIFLLVL